MRQDGRDWRLGQGALILDLWRRAVQGAGRGRGGEASENLSVQPRAVGAGLTVTYRGKKLFNSLEHIYQSSKAIHLPPFKVLCSL